MAGSWQKQEFYNMGKEFAFEGLEKKYFKASSIEELEAFEAGYNEALAKMNEQKVQKEEQVEPKMGK